MLHKILFTTTILISFFYSQNQNNILDQSFLEAEFYYLNQNYSNALKLYKESLKYNPSNPSIIYRLYEVNRKLKNINNAKFYLERAYNLNKNEVNIALELIEFYVFLNKHNAALRTIMSVNKLFPNDLSILYMRANLEYQLKDWCGLLKTYRNIYFNSSIDMKEKVLQDMYEINRLSKCGIFFEEMLISLINENNENISLNELIVSLYVENNQLEKSIPYFENLYKISNDINIIKLIGDYYYDMKEYLEAKKYYLFYLDKNNDTNVLKKILFISIINKELSITKDISFKLINQATDDIIGYEVLFNLLINEGEIVKATDIILNAQNDVKNNRIFLLIAQGFDKQKNYILSTKYYKKYLALNSESEFAKYHLAIGFNHLKDFNNCDSLFTNLIENSTNNTFYKNDYAYLLSNREGINSEHLEIGLNYAKSAVLEDPLNAAYLDTLGWIYYRLNSYELAKSYIQRSLSLAPNNQTILNHLGDIYKSLGNLSYAQRYYSRALYK